MDERIEPLLDTLPVKFHGVYQTVRQNGGRLPADDCQQLCHALSESQDSLMIALLPVAAAFSIAQISKFYVGAIAKSSKVNEAGFSDLFFGANIEIDELSLGFSLHAEQSAILNAWQSGDEINAMATSAAPCGHCRQFLNEVSDGGRFTLIIPTGSQTTNFKKIALTNLLPQAFGPKDLGTDETLMRSGSLEEQLTLLTSSSDEVILAALKEAQSSYAPYSKNYAGCVIETRDGKLYRGRYAENVAFNPSVIAMLSALNQWRFFEGQINASQINRVVLVEQPKISRQKTVTELLLKTLNNQIELECYEASALA